MMALVLSRRPSATMLTLFSAGQAALPGSVTPYHSGGCGFCTGLRIIGSLSNL